MMANKWKTRGVRFEREVVDIFKEHGYIAQRTADSRSPFDVVLIKENEFKRIVFVAFVQCKTTSQDIDIEKLIKIKEKN